MNLHDINDNPGKTKVSAPLRRYGLIMALVLVCVALAIARPNVLSTRYLLTLLRQISINGILALGVTFVLLTGGVDLSLGSMVALTGVAAACFAHPGGHILLVPVFVGILIGTSCGGVNGLFVTKARVAPFIATLGMMTVARGLAHVISGGRPISRLSPEFTNIGSGDILGIPIPIVTLIALTALSAIILQRTRVGRHIYATGGNEKAARASGINVHGIKIFAYALCGAFAGVAGVIQAARITTGQPNTGIMYELDAIAAVVIGGTSLSGGVGGVGGTILGALLMGVISSGLDLLNVSPYYQQIVKGVIIVGAVWLDRRGKK